MTGLQRLRRIAEKLVDRGPSEARSRSRDALRRRLAADPLNAATHRELAEQYAVETSLTARLRAHAEHRTAAALEALAAGSAPSESSARDGPGTGLATTLDELNHNQSYRFRTLAEAVQRIIGTARARVLDVGGGDGGLAWFLPEVDYVLAEPAVNGIDGAALPFPAASFDVVCACHVLEHIAPEQRAAFLDSMLAVSRRHVLLLNPFVMPDSLYPRRIELVLEITGAQWAREHLECGLPTLDEVTRFADSRGVECRVDPNGCLMTSLAMVYVTHYARLAGRSGELARINALFNAQSVERMTHATLPVAFLIHLESR
jgi:SAM-dependent methyltransferase